MKRRWMLGAMLVGALVVMVPRAWAQRPPDTDPPSGLITQEIKLSWDRSAMPGDIEVMPAKTLIAYDRDQTKRYGALFLTCASEVSTETGRCPTENTSEPSAVEGKVFTRLVEQRGGLRADIALLAAVYRADQTAACHSSYWSNQPYVPWTTFGAECDWNEPAGTGAGLRIIGSELSRLTAGSWKGVVELYLRKPPSQHLAKYVFNIDFTITDYDAISIYFPTFDNIAPLVNLDLRYDPIRQVVGGKKELDMCLYDGLGSQSEYLGITVRDSGPRPPSGSDFAVWHRDGGSDATQRLDYQVSLSYGGYNLAMKNGIEQQLRGIESTQLRLVMLPGISQPVYCVPTPLTLETPPTPVASKRPGLYEGELTVELRVPTAKP